MTVDTALYLMGLWASVVIGYAVYRTVKACEF
jgi:hypothetical protein